MEYQIAKNKLPFITSPLTHIYNKSVSSGTFPDRLKYAVVKHLFKKVDKTKFLIIDLYQF